MLKRHAAGYISSAIFPVRGLPEKEAIKALPQKIPVVLSVFLPAGTKARAIRYKPIKLKQTWINFVVLEGCSQTLLFRKVNVSFFLLGYESYDLQN